ncbi:restriction endonuclease subunit S [Neisseria dentiae]|uniref:restriction endonuclease subunit S n=1 Tax=Neisseria dentiae TaxID=194197 RepID=UPI00359F7C62
MSGWREETLENMLTISKSQFQPDNKTDLPYIGLEHINAEKLRINGFGSSLDIASNKFHFKRNDVLFGKLRPYFRKVIKAKFDGVCSTDIWVIRAKKEVHQSYLFYFLANWEFVDLANSGEGGSRMPRADWNFLKQTKWTIPPLPEQKAIADVLSALDDKIDLLHRQNHTLEQMAETLFRQWFVEEAQEDWEEKPLSSIATFTNGLACQKFPVQIGEQGLPVLKIKELTSGISDSSDWATETVKSEYIVENGDIIFAWSASLMVKIWSGQKCVLNQHLFNVKSKYYPKWFYYEWCKFHLAEFISVAQSHATTMGHIKRKDLDEAMVKIPSSETLATMSQTMKPLLDKRIINSQQIQTLETLRDTLLPKLISGEVRVAFQTA